MFVWGTAYLWLENIANILKEVEFLRLCEPGMIIRENAYRFTSLCLGVNSI